MPDYRTPYEVDGVEFAVHEDPYNGVTVTRRGVPGWTNLVWSEHHGYNRRSGLDLDLMQRAVERGHELIDDRARTGEVT